MDESDFMLKATETRVLISMLAKQAFHGLEQRLNKAKAGIGPLQHGILRRLEARESTNSELSREFMLSPSTLVPAIDSLEQKKLVVRTKDPEDRRRTPLKITEKGLALVQRVPYISEKDPLVQGLRQFSEDDVSTFLEYLKVLICHLPHGEEIKRSIEKSLENRTNEKE